MAVLVSPASYISIDDFKTIPNDYDLSTYTDVQLEDMLVRASGMADSIMRRSLLATEVTERLYGQGSNSLTLKNRPIIYVRKMQFVQPGVAGFIIPLDRVLIDTIRGEIVQYSPLELQGIGYISVFPYDLPIDVTYGYGYGYNAITPPAWTYADVPTQLVSLAPGTYTLGVTTKTQNGETLPNFQNVTTATGSIALTVPPQLGAYLYRVFLAPGANQGALAKLVSEIPATTFGGTPTQGTISSLNPPSGYFAESAPTSDTSALVLPQALREAVRLLTLQILYEQNNLANRGVGLTSSGRKRIQWRSTEGLSGKGVPLFYDQAIELLRPLSLQEIF